MFVGVSKKVVRQLLARAGYEVRRRQEVPPDIMEKDFLRIYDAVRNYTMTTPERVYSLFRATEYVVRRQIPGDFVECGVWRGGSAMTMALTLLKHRDVGRRLYLYDTFAGMSDPTGVDRRIEDGLSVHESWESLRNNPDLFCYASVDDVRKQIHSTGYPTDNFVLVEGKVEETISRDYSRADCLAAFGYRLVRIDVPPPAAPRKTTRAGVTRSGRGRIAPLT